MRYICTELGMGGSFKCVYFGSIYRGGGSCCKKGECEHKKPDPIELLKESQDETSKRAEK